jgi:hypothetical protein
MALFRRKPSAPAAEPTPAPAAPRVEWALARLVCRVQELAPALEAKDIEPALVQARLADHYRDAGLDPPEPAWLERQAGGLDGEAWRRLALAVGTLDDETVRATLPALAARVPVAAQVQDGFIGTAAQTDLLTLGLIRQSAVRAEEFVRQCAARLRVAIEGESEDESRRRLHALDYGRLLAEAEQAKAAAKEQMERLRKKQQEDQQRRRPRGKW